MKSKDLRSLLNRAAAALESPQELSFDDKQYLVQDLAQAAEDLLIEDTVSSVHAVDQQDAAEPLLEVSYRCSNLLCQHEWTEFWLSACDSTCGRCGLGNIPALSSKPVERDDEGSYHG